MHVDVWWTYTRTHHNHNNNMRRDALDYGYGRPYDHTGHAPAVLAVRQRGDASDSVFDRLLLLPVVPQRRVRTMQTLQKTGDPKAQFLDGC